MSNQLPIVYMARHGETEWSLSGQHTGLTDLPLTSRGEQNARRLGPRLAEFHFDHVLTSPLQRARRTCELAGFGERAVVDPDLVEWNYGEYEGRKTADIWRERPDWQLFRDGCPRGESVADISKRADRVVARLRALGGNALIFSSGHFLRVFGMRWCGCSAESGMHVVLGTASVSAVGYEHYLQEPAIQLWNDTHHLLD
jgi:broad specificity phosphatase PhoE